MAFLAIPPSAPLQGLVERLWDCDLPPSHHRFERILPQPRPALIINLAEDETRIYVDTGGNDCRRTSGTILSGPYAHSFVIDTSEQTRVMGVEFHPAGAYPLFGERLDLLAGRHVSLEALLGSRAAQLRQRLLQTPSSLQRLRLLDTWLSARLRGIEMHPLVRHAATVLSDVPQQQRIVELAHAGAMSPRRFGTLFREQIGLSPKRFARAMRFRAVIDAVHRRERVNWAAVAADCGFHDQPHLTREFRLFSGMTPGAYLYRRGEHVNHVPLD